jgi:histidinol-phosphate phosphatase family protein
MRVLLLDRDGTLNIDNGHVYTPDDLQLLPDVIDALTRFRNAGYSFFIMTNQGAIGKGLQTMEDYEDTESCLESLLLEGGIEIEGTYFCAHHPDDGCTCRKPAIGLWKQLQDDHDDVSASDCIMIGDKDTDILFGQAIGAKTARIASGQYPANVKADYEVRDLAALADILLVS